MSDITDALIALAIAVPIVVFMCLAAIGMLWMAIKFLAAIADEVFGDEEAIFGTNHFLGDKR